MAARFTTSDGPDIAPTWSPDGREVAFSSKRGSRYDVYTKTVDVITEEKRQPGPDGDNIVEDWSPDGKSILRTVIRNGLWHTPFDSQSKPSLIRPTSLLDRWLAEFSPDGRWIAYTSYASGDAEVYVEPADRSGAQYQVSTRGGAEPHWANDGRELFYLTLDKTIVSVDVARVGDVARRQAARALPRVDARANGKLQLSRHRRRPDLRRQHDPGVPAATARASHRQLDRLAQAIAGLRV